MQFLSDKPQYRQYLIITLIGLVMLSGAGVPIIFNIDSEEWSLMSVFLLGPVGFGLTIWGLVGLLIESSARGAARRLKR